ncbi:hypothetical protein [Halobellus litoreus]|uniref:Uncharacterized protein n=1 Tax=Halobellus litoreus TaxID=755310 RepID=A0ABD6DZG3_9EURY|nr:hypothetical protein [Halobellus litoreus]
MQREYRLAVYALAVSMLLLVASGAAIVAGGSQNDSPAEPHASEVERTQTANPVTATHSENVEIETVATNGTALTVTQGDRTCRGSLRTADPNRNRTDIQVGDTTVTLVEHQTGEPFDEIEREAFARLVWRAVADDAGLEEYDHVEVQVNQYYETVDREDPLDTVGIRVYPVDACLPTVEGEVALDNQSVTVQSSHPELEDLQVEITDTIGVLSDDDRNTITQLIESNEHTSYNIQVEFDNPRALEATVIEATNDGEVELELTHPDSAGRAVVVTVDLESETIKQTWVQFKIQSMNNTNVVAVGDSETNETITFETNHTENGSS